MGFSLRVFATVVIATSSWGCKQSYVEHEINKSLRNLEEKALSCLDREKLTADEVEIFFRHSPPIPPAKYLQDILFNKEGLMEQADAFSKDDKVKHCFMGYFLSENYDYETAIFVGYYKEAQDVGDCKRSTRFEIADQVATYMGADYQEEGLAVDECRKIKRQLTKEVAHFLEERERADQELFPQLDDDLN